MTISPWLYEHFGAVFGTAVGLAVVLVGICGAVLPTHALVRPTTAELAWIHFTRVIVGTILAGILLALFCACEPFTAPRPFDKCAAGNMTDTATITFGVGGPVWTQFVWRDSLCPPWRLYERGHYRGIPSRGPVPHVAR